MLENIGGLIGVVAVTWILWEVVCLTASQPFLHRYSTLGWLLTRGENDA